MLPVLLDFGFLKIYTFGVFLVLAFFWGSFFLWKNITSTSYKEDELFDGLFFSLIGGLLIGRLLYIVLHFSDFGFDILRFILINGYPGMHFIGFVFGFLIFWYVFTASKKISYLKCIDYIIPPLFLALAIGKMGSFFSGSEIGAQTTFFISLAYPNLDGARHLTPFYESLLFFLGSFVTFRYIFIIRKEKLHEGFNLIFFLWYFSLIQFVFDPLKAFRTMVQNTSIEMIISGILLLTWTVYFIYYFRNAIYGFIRSLTKKIKINNFENHMTKKDDIRKKLESEKNTIVVQLRTLKQSDPFEDPTHVTDNASVDTDVREQEAHQRIEAEMNTLKKRFHDIDIALDRLEKGLYGICKRCNKSIPAKRLELIPETINCVSCEEDLKK